MATKKETGAKKATKKKTMDVIPPKKSSTKKTAAKKSATKKAVARKSTGTVMDAVAKKPGRSSLPKTEEVLVHINDATAIESPFENETNSVNENQRDSFPEVGDKTTIEDYGELDFGDAVEEPESYTHESIKDKYRQEAEDFIAETSAINIDEEDIMPEKESKPANKAVKIISAILVLASAVSIGVLIYNISRSNLLPAKFFYPIVFVLGLVILLFLRFTIRKKTKLVTHIILDVFSVIFLGASLFGNFKLSETITFLDKNLNGTQYQTLTYNVISNKDAAYNSLSDVENKTIISPKVFNIEEEKLKDAVKDQAKANLEINEDTAEVTVMPINDAESLILLGDSVYASMLETGDTYKNSTKIVGSIEIEVKVEKDTNSRENITDGSFSIYLSGIDTRSGDMPYTSLSDVNKVITINPTTHKILITNIPRDYYVQIHGTTGLRDKLTHAGSLGGVQLSKATLEDLLGIRIDEYVRVNFNFVIELVDAIGGITINNHLNRGFVAHTDKNCYFAPGDNFVHGDCALAFARERYTYDDGDIQRAKNQEQVIEKIFDKMTNSSTLIGNYSNILEALTGTFETSLTQNDITNLIRFQLDKMPKWNMTTFDVKEKDGGLDYTYSYPTQPLFVFYEDQESVIKAKAKIQEILNEK